MIIKFGKKITLIFYAGKETSTFSFLKMKCVTVHNQLSSNEENLLSLNIQIFNNGKNTKPDDADVCTHT